MFSLRRTRPTPDVAEPNARQNQRILSISLAEVTKPEPINLRIENKGQNATISWDHLDPKTGFRLRVIYTGSNSPYIDSEISAASLNRMKFYADYSAYRPYSDQQLPLPDPRLSNDIWRFILVCSSSIIAALPGLTVFNYLFDFLSKRLLVSEGSLMFIILSINFGNHYTSSLFVTFDFYLVF
jgi:hypothetical protein